jgi:hypothetical protein
VLAKDELMRLQPAEKRQIVGALLQSAFRAPRSFPLSFAQEQLWFMDKLQPGSPVYNISLYVPFQGSFVAGALRRALDTVTWRHDMLRVHFDTANDQPVQIVEPDVVIDLPVEDLSRLPADQQSATFAALLNEEVRKPFDLAGLCVRYRLFKLDPSNHLLSATMHHIITDAWSLGVLVSELNAAYKAYRSGKQSAPLAPVLAEYSDYAQWQRATLRGLRLSKLLNYWTTQLAGAPHVLQLPTDHPRPKDQTFNGTLTGFVFDDELSEAVIALARQHRVTVFMLLLACYYTLLYRYTGHEDILVGAPVANRAHPELEPVIGIFVNTLILRIRLEDSQTFANLMRNVQAMTLAAFDHQALPFPKLVEELNVERAPGYPPLYQVVFNFQNASLIESDSPGAEGETMHKSDFPLVHSNTAKVDLNLTVTQNDSRISGGIEYNTDLFDSSTIDDMIGHYKRIVEQIVRDPSLPLMDIELGGDGENAQGPERRPAGDKSDLIELGKFSFE